MNGITAEPGTRDYRVNLEIFSGPLDLLLHLIKVEEVDIYDIPIARITAQYLKYVEMMKNLDLEVAGEFILMAATLIRIKTRLLLPHDNEDSDEPDPREELIMALVEYKKYKEAGEILRDRMLVEERHYVPPPPIDRIEEKVDLTPMTSLYDLVVAFKDVLANQRAETVHEVGSRRVTIEDRMKVVLELLKTSEYTTFPQLWADRPEKLVAVVTFIALLELARLRRIRLYQALPYSEVRVYRGLGTNGPDEVISLDETVNIDTQGVIG
jgi:segregation and condensation protein A